MSTVIVFELIIMFFVLTILLAFRYRPNISRFELERLAKTDRPSKTKLRFLGIYPGLKVFIYALVLVCIVSICAIALFAIGIYGTLLAFGIIVLSLLVARAVHRITNDFMEAHLGWFVKYLGWTEVLGKIALSGDEPKVHSRHELKYLIETGDFMDSADKMLALGSLDFNDKKVSDVMIPREKLITISAKDTIGPKLLDDLHQSGHSAFPVLSGGNIIGIFSINDALTLEKDDKIITDLMRPAPPIIHKNVSLESALTEMKNSHSCHLSVVNDNDKVVGLLGMGDILSVLFGRKLD